MVVITMNYKTGKVLSRKEFPHPDDVKEPVKVLAGMVIDYMKEHPEIIPPKRQHKHERSQP